MKEILEKRGNFHFVSRNTVTVLNAASQPPFVVEEKGVLREVKYYTQNHLLWL
jgi:hypothetical protein